MTVMTRPGTSGGADEPGRRKRTGGSSPNVGGHVRIRKDVEGLRAVATLLVLPYHANFLLFPGGFVGVDVFFVISGFVITAQLLRDADRDGKVSLVTFYARRAKRLLPAASLVLVATAVMVWAWVPKIRWGDTGGDIVASALYFVNWHLAGRSVDYLAEDVPPSPVQHYWSLSVEEQFYFVWPVLVVLAVWIAARMKKRRSQLAEGDGIAAAEGGSAIPMFRPVLLMIVGLLIVVSLLWSTYSAINSPERAYFDTTARMWEFAAGTVVAILVTFFDRIPKPVAVTIAWGGFAMILVAGRFYDKDVLWPGPLALLPIIGASLFIAGGAQAGKHGPVLILGNRPIQFIGALTYSLYLWHWPLLIVAREHYDGISVFAGMVIVVLCVIPAYLSYKLVENPIRHSRFVSKHARAALGVGVISTAVAVIAGLLLSNAFLNATAGGGAKPGENPLIEGQVDTTNGDAWNYGPIKAPALGEQPTSFASLNDIAPNPLEAQKDVPDLYAEGCQTAQDSAEVNVCTYGASKSAADLTIAVVGDSKAAQWVPALQVLAPEKNWRVETYTKSACPFVDATITYRGGPYTECREWGKDVLKRLTGDDKPDVVLTASMRKSALVADSGTDETSTPAIQEGMLSYWKQLEDAGVTVISLADTPQTGGNVYECLAESIDDPAKCSYDREKGIEDSGIAVQREAAEEAKIPFIDMTDYVCPATGDTCPPTVGNILIYRQGSHITKTYVESVATVLGTAIEEAITWSEDNR